MVPLLAVLGWLIFGPRGLTSRRVAWLSLLFPACWMAFTLIRGAVIHLYPYPFIDVSVIGYGKAILNAFWFALLLLGLAAGATALDSRLGRAGGQAILRAPGPGTGVTSRAEPSTCPASQASCSWTGSPQ